MAKSSKEIVQHVDSTKVISNWGWSLDDVMKLNVIGRQRNEWRRRNAVIYQHPNDAEKIVSVGESFDRSVIVICEESKKDWDKCIRQFPATEVYR